MTYPWPTLMPMGIVVVSCVRRPSNHPWAWVCVLHTKRLEEMAYNLACWCIQMAYTQHSWMLMDIVVGLSVRPSVRLFVYGIFRWLCICWQITWNKWHKIWHADVSPSLISLSQHWCWTIWVFWVFLLFFFIFFFLRLGLGQRRAVVIIGRWLLPSLVDTGDICCHYWQHILVISVVVSWVWIAISSFAHIEGWTECQFLIVWAASTHLQTNHW